MNSTELGRRIREARLAKKLTQAEVVGDFITRNMLSQIESGSALPSVKTLQYLSRVLEVPMSQLVPTDNLSGDEPSADESPAGGAAEYMRARELLSKGEYAQLAAIPDIADFSDELAALRAKAFLELSRRLQDGAPSQLQEAAEHAKRAAQLAERGMFANPSVRSEALLLLNTIAGRLSDYYKSMMTGELEEVGV